MPSAQTTASLGTLTDGDRLRLALGAGAIIGTWFWDVTADTFTVDEQFATAFGIDPALGRSGLSLAYRDAQKSALIADSEYCHWLGSSNPGAKDFPPDAACERLREDNIIYSRYLTDDAG